MVPMKISGGDITQCTCWYSSTKMGSAPILGTHYRVSPKTGRQIVHRSRLYDRPRRQVRMTWLMGKFTLPAVLISSSGRKQLVASKS